ncbi:MAG: hypothetical protein ACRCVX_03900 [Shewanella sp.]
MDEDMFYVAGDPAKPGTAWALTQDDPGHAKEVAATIDKWARRGAIIERHSRAKAVAMVLAWEKPN